jgi:hypothetical protein
LPVGAIVVLKLALQLRYTYTSSASAAAAATAFHSIANVVLCPHNDERLGWLMVLL